MFPITLRRVYDPRLAGEGRAVLIDRLWPRGIRKAELADALWLKEVAPSTGLRVWFHHNPDQWAEFKRRYRTELEVDPAPLTRLRQLAQTGPLTLLYASRDREQNHAQVLRDLLQGAALRA